jgi:4-diphosphocytidyl-2-C-methyl-D-erythritol kinase
MLNEIMEMKLSGRSKAKINLCLQVQGRADNGYHYLQSITAFCDVGDELEIAPSNELSLQIMGEFAGELLGDDNIVLQAAQSLRQYADMRAGAAMILHKNLPVASGIGGGSGDAAMALKMLNNLWNCGLNDEQLQQIGLQLGADVPVCLHGQICLMAGIGEILTTLPFNADGLYAVLVNPLQAVSTAEVFKTLSADDYSGALQISDDLMVTLQQNRNDLQNVAMNLCPEIALILEFLQAQPQTLLARMSGSGATCFALCANIADAQHLAKAAQSQFPDYWVAVGAIS